MQYGGDPIEIPENIQQLLESITQDLGNIPDDYLQTEVPDPNQDEASSGPSPQAASSQDSEATWLYDEWDHSRQKYRKEWCRLKELEVEPVHDGFVPRTLDKHRGLLKHLHRTFESLREDDRRIKRQPYGDDVDLDAVIEAFSDTRIGLEASQNLFTRSRKVDRNIAVMFMIDMSGSTAGWVNEMEREALVLLCESLEILAIATPFMDFQVLPTNDASSTGSRNSRSHTVTWSRHASAAFRRKGIPVWAQRSATSRNCSTRLRRAPSF